MARLEGKVAIITGAAGGIGLSAAQLFAQEGATTILADVSSEGVERAAADIRGTGGAASAMALDVSSPDAWSELVDHVIKEHGRVDVLVNNAGIQLPRTLLDATLDEWNAVMGVNVTGTWLGMKYVIPHMQSQGGGSIVNLSSIAGIVGGASDGGAAAYSASKGAVRSLTKHAAQWFAKDNIRVNSVHPGSVYTPMAAATGMSKEELAGALLNEVPLPPHIGEPSDIGYGILYLASDEAKYVTGEELIIDGGWTSH